MPDLSCIKCALPHKPQQVMIALGIFLSPSLAQAHGEEVIMAPVGQGIALWLIFLFAKKIKIEGIRKIILLIISIGVAAAIWVVPGNYFPVSLRYTGWGNFICGFAPPFVVGVITGTILKILTRVQN